MVVVEEEEEVTRKRRKDTTRSGSRGSCTGFIIQLGWVGGVYLWFDWLTYAGGVSVSSSSSISSSSRDCRRLLILL